MGEPPVAVRETLLQNYEVGISVKHLADAHTLCFYA
jgi:hypothetical protein